MQFINIFKSVTKRKFTLLISINISYMKFLRNLLAAILGTLIALGLLFFIFIGIASVMGEKDKVVVKDQSVLAIKLNKEIKDYAPKSDDPFEQLLKIGSKNVALNQILNAIENAKDDPKIKGITIGGADIKAGTSQLREIRNKLNEFKETGKFVTAYADVYSQKLYYLSSVADSIYLNPVGALDFKGLSSEVLYLKKLQEKTGVKMEVIRHGKYKSAVEPFLTDEMSENNREQIKSFLTSIWGQMVADISASRNLTDEELNRFANELKGRNATLAKESNLIDAAIYKDEYINKLKLATGKTTEDKLNVISIKDYISTGKGRLKSSAKNKIAVIFAQGEIIYGKGDEKQIGNELIISALRKAKKRKDVKAIVLRVNSPGGSALSSELMWRELELTKEKLPVVVSMGDVAASGGYYIACNANKIIAEPTTITGSIGVFGVIPNFKELADDMGVNAEQVSTNNSPNYSPFEPMTDAFRTVTKEGVEQVYTTFLNRVAKGRNLTTEQVDAIAQGRVWSGLEAKENGLVDELGGLELAITKAAELANITDYKVRNYPNYKKDFENMFSSFPLGKTKENILKEELGESTYKLYKTAKSQLKIKGIQARLPYELLIK